MQLTYEINDGSFRGLGSQPLALLKGIIKHALHVEGGFGVVVALAFEECCEPVDGVLEGHEFALPAGEDLAHEERLGEELLDLAGPGHSDFVLLRELVHAQNGNNILQGFVILQQFLHTPGHGIMPFPDNNGVKDSTRRVKRVDSGIDPQFSQPPGQHGRGIQESESGGRGRISQIVGRHVDGLHGGDRALFCGGDALLEGTEIGGEGRLVAHGRGNTAQQGRHLGAGLREPEDVVDEQQHVFALLVTEILGHSQPSESDPCPGTWRLIHLPVDESAPGSRPVDLDDPGLDHLVVEIIALSGALTHSCEDRVTAMSLGHIVDQFLDDDSFAHPRASEQADLSTPSIGCQQIHHLDARDKDLSA
jgi:hypothetical protein